MSRSRRRSYRATTIAGVSRSDEQRTAVATISPSSTAVTAIKADAVVVGGAFGSRGLGLTDAAKAVEAALGVKLATLLPEMGHDGKAEQIAKLPGGGVA